MKRTLFLLLFYFCLTITVGKQMRMFCSQLVAAKSSIAQTLALDYSQSEAENEGADSEDSEIDDEYNDDHELISNQILYATGVNSFSNSSSTQFHKNHFQEIGTPPPRF